MSLNLVANEVVGYRIKPDWYCFNVVLVKRHGPLSKNAGKEYETILAHCKNLPFAVSWLVSHAARMHGELSQKEALAVSGSVADAQALAVAFEKAQADALRAVNELQARLDAAGLNSKAMVHLLGGAPDEDAPEPDASSEVSTA